MFERLRAWLGRQLPHSSTVAVRSHSSIGQSEIPAEDLQNVVPYDENLLERSRTQWQFGDWESLAKIQRDTLQHHPDRAKLALLAAAGHLQQGNSQAASQFTRLAQDWGCSKKLISQILISGVNNSLGRAAAISGQNQRALRHFESAIEIGSPGGDRRLLSQARSKSQSEQIGIPLNQAEILALDSNTCLEYSAKHLIHEGYEAFVYRVSNQVFKVYKSSYFQYNKNYERRGEGLFLRRNPSKFFISLLQENPAYIVLPYAGERIGDVAKLHHEEFNNKKLCRWLLELKEELNRFAIKHRDINPSNILYHRERDEFILIDFGWAIGPDESDKEGLHPEAMNCYYGTSDDEAIEKMIVAATQHLNETSNQ
jgi:serine/threonine protein kinase